MTQQFATNFKMHKTNNADAFKIPHSMLSISGIWPKKDSNLIYKVRYTLSWVLTVSFFITMAIEVISNINNLKKLSEAVYIMFALGALVLKMATLTYYKNTFLEILEFLKEPVFNSYSIELDYYIAKTVKYSILIEKCYRMMITVSLILILLFPILDNKPLPYPFPFEVGIYTSYVYAFQLIAVGTAAWNTFCIDTLIVSLLRISAAQFDILREKIVHVTISDQLKKPKQLNMNVMATKALKECVDHHNAIIKLVEDIEQVFTVALFAQFMASVIVICNTVFQIVLIKQINWQFIMMFQYFLSMMFQLFLYCWHGNEITLKSAEIGDACYHCNWYERESSIETYLFIIMERSKRPLAITTLKLSNVSIVAFKSMLQWSYSCLALLLNMYQKQAK